MFMILLFIENARFFLVYETFQAETAQTLQVNGVVSIYDENPEATYDLFSKNKSLEVFFQWS